LKGHSEICQASKIADEIKGKVERALVVAYSTADSETFDVIGTASVLSNQVTPATTESELNP